MRFIILLAAIVLTSCATPKTAPQSFYEGVYVPGLVEFSDDGLFSSNAGVLSGSDLAIARKAAFARFMLSAKEKGFRYFEITAEKTRDGIGKVFKLTGRAYKSVRDGDNIYPIDAIKRLLQGLPLEEPKPVYQPAPAKQAKAVKKASVAKKKRKPIKKVPAVQPPKKVEEPLVIMAPEDITGSIKKAGRQPVPGAQIYITQSDDGVNTYNPLPPSVSDLPSGVILRRQ